MQPKPSEQEFSKEVWSEVAKDMAERVHKGEQTYGTRLKTFNSRHALTDLYEELLDAVFYLKQHLMEQEQYREWMQSNLDRKDTP